jgi:CubicO group peptidase (beta-lactamase class C family)
MSGVVGVNRGSDVVVTRAAGLADRRHLVPITPRTRMSIASGTKGATALTVMSLVADGTLSLDTTARSLLGDDLTLIDDSVTVEHLLSHRSGIGDYIDESSDLDLDDVIVPAHQLDTTEAYITVLDGHPGRETPGSVFRYNNSGYVVLALLAQRATGETFERLVADRVTMPAGMVDTGFLRSDSLPGDVAVGYLTADGLRTNALHLPVLGSGDGGLFTTVADMHRSWLAMYADLLVPHPLRSLMTTARSDTPNNGLRYGMGFWLHPDGRTVQLEGMDAGVSFRSVHDPATGTTHTVISNTSLGAWRMSRALDDALGLS